jgi:heterodisulfide reductase subunit D
MSKKQMKNLSTVKSFIYNCRKCGACGYKVTGRVPYVCPVREATAGFEHFYSRGKIIIAQGMLEGSIAPSQTLAEASYSCTLCGNCMVQCGATDQETGQPLVNTTKIVEAMRADILEQNPELVDRAYQALLKSTRQYDNPWGVPRATKGRWTKGLGLKDAQKDQAEVLLFTGCTVPSNPALTGRAKKSALILKKAGVDFAVLGQHEPCCGSVQKRIGDLELAREMMLKNSALLNSIGCDTIVTLCAGCCSMLKNEYAEAEAGLKPRVLHFVEYLEKLVAQKKLSFPGKKTLTVAYHDPCHLGRHLGVFDAPREILQKLPGITLVERDATRENTICCGAGGGMRIFAGGAIAEEIGIKAVTAAQQAGAEAIVTACPFCELNLEAAANRLDDPLPVYDIVDVVCEALT